MPNVLAQASYSLDPVSALIAGVVLLFFLLAVLFFIYTSIAEYRDRRARSREQERGKTTYNNLKLPPHGQMVAQTWQLREKRLVTVRAYAKRIPQSTTKLTQLHSVGHSFTSPRYLNLSWPVLNCRALKGLS